MITQYTFQKKDIRAICMGKYLTQTKSHL